MKYKIYRLASNGITDFGFGKQLILDEEFEYEEFDTIEEAISTIERRGERYIHYTVLPYIYFQN